jgi:hypothetical protein
LLAQQFGGWIVAVGFVVLAAMLVVAGLKRIDHAILAE